MTHPRHIPSIEVLKQRPHIAALTARYGPALVLQALRAETDTLRLAWRASDPAHQREDAGESTRVAAAIDDLVAQRLATWMAPSLRAVINATGVVIHTNLGRAPLSRAAIDEASRVASRYSTLEFDLVSGSRGHRDIHAEGLLCRLMGVESAVVANNCAAATMLTLAALAAGREVIVSRGELVEIGGGFRVPDVLRQSGAILVEVGTTNRTRAADYAAAITDRTALLLRVHRSNFRIEGFTETPGVRELVAVARERKIPVVEDLGNGNLLDAAAISTGLLGIDPAQVPGLEALIRSEPTVQASVSAGVDVLCISGDKLLGGPQAGIILGRRHLVATVRRHPLMRALRVDKLTYGALTGTLGEYASGRAADSIPVLRMLTMTPSAIERRVQTIIGQLPPNSALQVDIMDGQSTIGGGTAPGVTLPTRLLTITHATHTADGLGASLRQQEPPIIARIEHDRVLLDLRTVMPDEDAALAQALRAIGSSDELPTAHPPDTRRNIL